MEPLNCTYAEQLAAFASNLEIGLVPRTVTERVKIHVLDAIGIALSSMSMDYARILYETIEELGGKQDSTVIGWGKKLPASAAALVNGNLIHGIDFDDTHLDSITHVSCCVVPAALAMAERTGRTGDELLGALLVGFEVMIRIGLVAAKGFDARGHHVTPHCGIFGAAAASGRLLGLNSEGMANAFGICGSLACGSLEFLQDGSWTKRLHAGWAASAGIISSLLSQRGYTGPKTVLEGRFGFFPSHLGSEEYQIHKLVEQLGTSWKAAEISLKKYPCCHIIAGYLDAMSDLKSRSRIQPEEIVEVVCYVNPQAVATVCEPLSEKLEPSTPYSSQFSLPYAIAIALEKDHIGIADFAADPRIMKNRLALARKVRYVSDPSIPYPEKLSARVELRLRSGERLAHFVEFPEGSVERPMAYSSVESKFLHNVTVVLSERSAKTLRDRIMGLEKIKDVSKELMELCTSEKWKVS